MHHRTMLSSVALAALLTATALAGGDIDPDGKPEGFDKGDVAKYAVWKGEKGWWHVLWTTAGKPHHFAGEVHIVEGKFGAVKRHDLEALQDWVVVGPERHNLAFKTRTEGALDGFSFETGGKAVTFHLGIDGDKHPNRVFIGKSGANPDKIPFRLKN